MVTGLSILEINALVEQGAIIEEDGTIQLATVVPEMDRTLPGVIEIPTEAIEEIETSNDVDEGQSAKMLVICIGAISIVIGIIVIVCVGSKNKQQTD